MDISYLLGLCTYIIRRSISNDVIKIINKAVNLKAKQNFFSYPLPNSGKKLSHVVTPPIAAKVGNTFRKNPILKRFFIKY